MGLSMEKITTFIAYWLAVALAYLGAISPEKMALYVGGGCAILPRLRITGLSAKRTSI